jgi:hypothetical protein
MLLFVLKGLQSVMLTSPIKEKNTIKSVKNPHSSKNNTKPSYRAKTNATTYKG